MNSVLTNGKHWAVENWTKSAHTHTQAHRSFRKKETQWGRWIIIELV